MKLRVAYAKRRYKDKVYQTPLVVTSYRDENGVARNQTVLSLAALPRHAVKALEKALKNGDDADRAIKCGIYGASRCTHCTAWSPSGQPT